MLRHLDGWARRRLGSAEAWGSTLELCGQWADYSARNQVLLASYGVATPVAGASTWARVPSVEEDRGCAVRAGEHGLPVRVPVVDDGVVESDRSRFSARSRAVAGGHRWELVFAAEQLARRPAADAVVPVPLPRLTRQEWVEMIRVASGRVLGRMPRRIEDPVVQLGGLAGRVSCGSGRMRLAPELAAQAGWLVATRVGLAEGPLPAFVPGGLQTRERWQRLVDVRHAAGVVLAGVSHALGVDLARSPLPRHDLVEDRTVPAGRRNYLAPADLRGLPVGVWVEAGPYTRAEWLARGVAGASGVGAFLRVTDRSYLAVYESTGGAMWRMETVGRGSHAGLITEGTADTVVGGKDAARVALADRYPEVAGAIESPVAAKVVARGWGWMPLPDGRDDRTERRVFDERVHAVIAPGPGGRWETWATVDGILRQGPLAPTRDDARTTAEVLGRDALGELARYAPDRADRLIRDLAATPEAWDRTALVHTVGHRLADHDRHLLATTSDPATLADLMKATGVLTPATMVDVLHAERADAHVVAGLLPTIGLPIPDAVLRLHHDWGMDRLDAGAVLGATVAELKSAGCTPVELLAADPREMLRSLDSRESTWEVAAATLLESGYSRGEAVAHLVAHAPSPASFAAGVTAIVDDPVEAFAHAARRTQPEDLAVLSERYGLDPAETGRLLAAAAVHLETVVEVIGLRCDRDPVITADLVEAVLGPNAVTLTPDVAAGVNREVIALTPGGDGQLVEPGVDW